MLLYLITRTYHSGCYGCPESIINLHFSIDKKKAIEMFCSLYEKPNNYQLDILEINTDTYDYDYDDGISILNEAKLHIKIQKLQREFLLLKVKKYYEKFNK